MSGKFEERLQAIMDCPIFSHDGAVQAVEEFWDTVDGGYKYTMDEIRLVSNIEDRLGDIPEVDMEVEDE